MKYIKRECIDVNKWDACIKDSSTLMYAFSWYLDELCPNWDALIVEKEGRYVACFPVPWKRKFGKWMAIVISHGQESFSSPVDSPPRPDRGHRVKTALRADCSTRFRASIARLSPPNTDVRCSMTAIIHDRGVS